MPGPIGVGKKITRTVTAYRRKKAVTRGVSQEDEGRDLVDNVNDYQTVKAMWKSSGPAEPELPQVNGYENFYYAWALEMCANAGQEAIIEGMGQGAFSEAAMDHNDGGDASDMLLFLCPHPEAVGDILMEVGGEIGDEVEMQWDEWGYY